MGQLLHLFILNGFGIFCRSIEVQESEILSLVSVFNHLKNH